MSTANHPSDLDFSDLVDASRALETQHQHPVQWADSPFEWLKLHEIRTRGSIGEALVEKWLSEHGFHVTTSPDSDADQVINDCRAEIKFAMLSKSGMFVFNQFRDQDYKFAVCLGATPIEAYSWAIPKHKVLEKPRGVRRQHARSDDTLMLTFRPEKPPAWLDKRGGSLSDARMSLTRLVAHQT